MRQARKAKQIRRPRRLRQEHNMALNRPNDLFQGPSAGGPPINPQAAGARPPVQGNLPRGGPPGQGGGMNPGGMQAVKAGIQQLLKMGLNEEKIVEAILKLVAESGLDIPEEQIRALIEQTASGQGDAPQGGVPQAPAGAPPINLPANL